MKQHSVLWWFLLLLGLAGTLWLLAFRFSAEQADRDVLAVMSPHIARGYRDGYAR